MDYREKIWSLAKMRFLHGEASMWIFGNKAIETLFFISFAIWIYSEFVSSSYIKYAGLIGTVFSFMAMKSRYDMYEGFFDGYEQGFMDAATKNLDYWGRTHSKNTDARDIQAAMREIEESEEIVSTENKASRETQINKGFNKLTGIVLTWRKL
jgi:hypothetical protein